MVLAEASSSASVKLGEWKRWRHRWTSKIPAVPGLEIRIGWDGKVAGLGFHGSGIQYARIAPVLAGHAVMAGERGLRLASMSIGCMPHTMRWMPEQSQVSAFWMGDLACSATVRCSLYQFCFSGGMQFVT